MSSNLQNIEKDLWDTADKLRANTHLRASEYSVPVLGLIFLRFADEIFEVVDQKLKAQQTSGSRMTLGPANYKAEGAIYLDGEARFAYLRGLKGEVSVGAAINKAMRLIEEYNEDLAGSLPTNSYTNLDDNTLRSLLNKFASISIDIEGDVFGKIYEYFLGEFALSEGQRGGEFFTPTSIVKLIVEIIEPLQGLIFDPACGSGGMFVQSAEFVKNHQRNPSDAVSIYGQEKTLETVRLCKMNLAVHGLSGEIKDANSYSQDEHKSAGRFDFVMANPPFNVSGIDKTQLASSEQRFPFGVPRGDNGNYLWIQMFYSALNPDGKPGTGRAGFVMPNSASDARSSEQEIRRKIIEDRVVDVMVSVGSNFFYTVTLPCTLWFFDKQKRETERGEKVLFIDARHIFTQIDRAHREFIPEQIEFLANIVRLYRGEPLDSRFGSEPRVQETFPGLVYADVAGLCKAATIDDIKTQGWSLNPGRYVGVAERAAVDFDFKERLEELNEELEVLNVEAHGLEEQINENINKLLDEDETGE